MSSGKIHTHIANVSIVTDQGVLQGTLHLENEKISSITSAETGSYVSDEPESGETYDGEGGWLLPGFIDVHVHGGYGADFMDADRAAYERITRFHALHGTTSMLATTVTAPKEAIEAVLAATAAFRMELPVGAKLAGVHVEGPFISPLWPGAQNPAFIVPPNVDWLQRWHREWPDLIRVLTLAPETEGAAALIGWLSESGIVAACGHTDATYDQIEQAAAAGLTHAVHTYNAMRPLHHREPGTVGAVLDSDAISAEVIADGHHVHPAAIRLLARAKPAEKLLLITDAIAAAGLGDGRFELGGLEVTVSGGVARLTGGNSLAGSTLTMAGAFRYMAANSGLSVPEISRLASANPARLLGIFDSTGSIAPGKQADLVLLDPNFNVRRTWVDGVPVAGF